MTSPPGRTGAGSATNTADGAGAATTVAAPADPRGPGELVRPDGLRRRIAAHMVRSLATSPHAAMAVEVRFDAVEADRATRGSRPPGMLAYLARATAQALTEFPMVNASWEEAGIRVFEQVNLGIAVDLRHEGLVVPVVHRANELDLTTLHDRITDVTARTHQRRLGVTDVTGGTFTLSSLGRSGTLFTVPVINQPQAAILSFDSVADRPVVVRDGGRPRLDVGRVAVLTASFDHRVFDGAYCAAFLGRIRHLIESAADQR
ncbi:2-oxo acid dehydrogenase subunit E2 [Micromonospora sp. LOL_021]|uniref:2-oxo acid dehydrogenase subunit E2 n=1 Tax=Micromonospora sp. LOL_021 TaxID=3345417 RepID=UPI003A89D71E